MPVHLYKGTDIVMGSVPHGADLIDFLTAVCEQRGIAVGAVSLIGSVTEASIGYYDQKTQAYSDIKPAPGPMEIVSGLGNISLRDGKPFPHLHVVLSGPSGECVAGHVNKGTKIFAAEFSIARLEGPSLTRGPDKTTGLSLWRE